MKEAMCARTCMPTRTHAHSHAFTLAHMHACIRARIHACTLAYMYKHRRSPLVAALSSAVFKPVAAF